MSVEPEKTNMAARNQQNLLFLDCSGGSRPSDKGGGGRSLRKYFLSFGPHFGLKITEGWTPGPPPLNLPLDCYYSPSGLSHGEHVTCERVRLPRALARIMLTCATVLREC